MSGSCFQHVSLFDTPGTRHTERAVTDEQVLKTFDARSSSVPVAAMIQAKYISTDVRIIQPSILEAPLMLVKQSRTCCLWRESLDEYKSSAYE